MLAVFAIALLAALPFAPQLHEGDTVPPIALVDQDGRTFGLANLRGRSVVLSFIYTRCTDSCALVAAKLARLAREADPRTVSVIALTVDPAYDRPAQLRRYRALFEAPSRWALATGRPQPLLLLERRLGVAPESKGTGSTDHAGLVVILDGDRRIARFISGDNWTPGQIAALARAAGGGPSDPFVVLSLILSDVASRCGRGAASLGAGAALLIACALAAAIGVPLVRALFGYPAS